MTTPLMEIITACENYLGWQPAPNLPLWQARSIEINKLNRAIKKNPQTNSITNLRLAVAYSRRKRLPLTSPTALLTRIPDALERAYTPPPVSDLASQINAAIRWEQRHDDPASLRWIYRLTRSYGAGRTEVLAEWKAASRG